MIAAVQDLTGQSAKPVTSFLEVCNLIFEQWFIELTEG